jgi:hypothetical protein
MLAISRNTPSVTAAVAQLRALPDTLLPVVTAKALTFAVQQAQKAVVQRMRTAFDRPTAYTLNSTRIVPAKPDALTARLAVKDVAPANGTLPEDYLFPQVYSGARRVKRFERAMRYAGVLSPTGFAILGKDAPTDAAGNLPRGEMQRILTATRTAFDPAQRRTDSRRSRKNARNAPYFVAGLDNISMVGGEMVRTRRGKLQPGVYKRVGRGVLPVLIFTSQAPKYRTRLNFEAIARLEAEREMPAAFQRAWRATVKA